MGNSPLSETRLIEEFTDQLRKRLPAGWSVRRARSSTQGRWQPDAIYEISAPGGQRGSFAVEAKRQIVPRDAVVQQALWLSLQQEIPVLVLSEYLSPRAREILDEANLNYADLTGSMRLRMDKPGIFMEVASDTPKRRVTTERRELQSLKSAAAGRGVRALSDFRPPYGVRDFASRAGLSPATSSRLIDFLDKEALIDRDSPKSAVRRVDWASLLRRWAQDYRFETSNRVVTFIEPRTLPGLLEKLRAYSGRYAVTGSFAAIQWAPIAPPRLAAVYVDDVQRASKELKLTPTEAGINVLLAEPFDPVVFERTKAIDDIIYAAPSQVVPDLLNGPGRAPQEADALIQWMDRNERAWRS